MAHDEVKIGRPSSWNNGPTQTIRVPITLAEQVMRYARELDKRGQNVLTQKAAQHRSIA
jgi:hypothetical protein